MPRCVHYLVLALFLSAFAPLAFAQKAIRKIEIVSGWGGLGTPRSKKLTIQRQGSGYLTNGVPIDAKLVEAFAAAIAEPPLEKPDAANLGITPAWLKVNALRAERLATRYKEAVPAQTKLYVKDFSDPVLMLKLSGELFSYSMCDNYPYATVDVTFEDGSTLSLNSHSYYVFMIPWNTDSQGHGGNYNANISRALAALLPPKSVNISNLTGSQMLQELADDLFRELEPEWNMLGVENRAGDALAALRSRYTVVESDINPYSSEEFGVP